MLSNQRVYLREWRLAKGLTQPELAKRTGTVKSEVSRLEKGARRMTVDWMNKFATAMGVSVEDLMTLPPMGFGAVSPPPEPSSDAGGVYSPFALGDITFGIKSGVHQVVTISGDDWSGTFSPGDVLIYDTSKRSTTVPGLFAIKLDGEVIVRRVTPTNDGIQLTCANKEYPAMSMGDLSVAGRVIARAHRL